MFPTEFRVNAVDGMSVKYGKRCDVGYALLGTSIPWIVKMTMSD